MKKIVLAAAIVVFLPAFAAAQSAAQSNDASGRWETIFHTQNGPVPATMILKKDGEKLAGTISGAQGQADIGGTQKGAAVMLSLTVDTGNGPMTITLSGTQDGESMAGSADFGGQGQGEWQAKRAGDAAASASAAEGTSALDVSGTWGLEVTTQADSGAPVVTLEQDGEKLAGRYSGQLGEAPISGTLKGNAITFQFDVDIQGTSVRVVYSGTVDRDSMKGTVTLGELGGGTFTGSRKK